MFPLLRHVASGTICVALTAGMASAELTAQDVWDDWKSYITGFGYDVTGQANSTNDGLTVSGVTISLADPDAPAGAVITMDQIVMTETADGSVSVDLPAVMPIEFSIPSETGGTDRISMDYRQTGMDIVVSGSPEAMQYVYDAETVTLVSTGFEVNGQILPTEANQIELTLEGLSGTSDATIDSLRRYTQALSVASIRYMTKSADPVSGSTSDVTGQWQNISFEGESNLPLREIDDGDMDALLDAGLSGNGTFGYDANATTIAVTAPDGTLDASIVSSSGEIGVALAQDGVDYSVSQQGTQVEAATSRVPIPLSFEISDISGNIAFPIQNSGEADDFALGFELAGFSMADMLWNIFDPGGQLPRDPATVAIDLVGKARLLFDVLDPAAAAEFSAEETPLELNEVDINRLEVTVAGASLSGDGAFAFENQAGAAPQPVGAIDLSLMGGNGLLDKLVATGLLPENQAMGARMMLGLLAVPGDAPDTLNSRIEFNEQGHVLANGQRIQ